MSFNRYKVHIPERLLGVDADASHVLTQLHLLTCCIIRVRHMWTQLSNKLAFLRGLKSCGHD